MNTLPRGVSYRHRARAVSTLVLHSRIDTSALDQAALEKQILQTVDRECWQAGEILLVGASVPRELAEPMLSWMRTHGVRKNDIVDAGTMHACEGSWYHVDGAYSNVLFCVAWLENTDAWDLVFPQSDVRVELEPGTIVLFDPCNVHGVVGRGKTGFKAEELGDHGVQAFASLCIKTTPQLMRTFDSKWMPLSQANFHTGWDNQLCQRTGKLPEH